MEFDGEFKFAKIQKSHFVGWGKRGGGWWNQFPTFDAEFKFAKKKIFFCEKFSKFSGKNWNGFVLVFEYRVVRYTSYSEPQKEKACQNSKLWPVYPPVNFEVQQNIHDNQQGLNITCKEYSQVY